MSSFRNGFFGTIATQRAAAGGGIQFVGGISTGNLFATTLSLTALAGGIGSEAIEGDIVVVAILNSSAVDRRASIGVTTGGYTELSSIFQAGTAASNHEVFYKIMTATPDAEVGIDLNGASSDGGTAIVAVYRGVDQTTPIDVSSTTANGTGNDPNPAQITPVTAGALIVIAAQGTANAEAPSGLTDAYLLDSVSDVSDSAGTPRVSGKIGSVPWTGGTYDPAVITCTNTETGTTWAATTIALRPA